MPKLYDRSIEHIAINEPKMSTPISHFEKLFCEQMECVLLNLLETKVLYQNCSFDPEVIKNGESVVDPFSYQAAVESYKRIPVPIVMPMLSDASIATKIVSDLSSPSIFAPKTVCTSCSTCKGETTPHNPIHVSQANKFDVAAPDQTYVLSYQCQKCKRGTLVFLVRKQGFKLQLVGRSQIPSLTIPKSFPKQQIDWFSDAQMAYQTGSHLAAICLLRVALEQYLRVATESEGVCTGDQLWARFKEKLPSDFPYSRVTGLGEIYSRLSEIIHDPLRLCNDSYQSCVKELDSFFRHLDLFPMMG